MDRCPGYLAPQHAAICEDNRSSRLSWPQLYKDRLKHEDLLIPSKAKGLRCGSGGKITFNL